MESATEPRLVPQGYLGKSARLLRELGPVALATRLLRRASHSLVETGGVTFFVRDLMELGGAASHPPDPPLRAGSQSRRSASLDREPQARPLPEFCVRQLRASDKEALLHGSESRWETLWSRFQGGDLCFAALDEQGRAVHTRWLTLTGARIPELEMDFVPAPDAAYFYDGYTRPDARRRGIDAIVRAAIFEALRALGRGRVYSYVRNDNPEGLRAAGRCQQVVGTVRHLRLFGSRPLLFGADRTRLAALLRRPSQAGLDDVNRDRDWRCWFEGWLREPLAKRSIGFHELPEDAFEAFAQQISSMLHLDPSRDIVLDLGCDSAMVSRLVAPHCARLVGVDFIPGMLLDAKRRRGIEDAVPSNLCFAAADGRSLPFPSETFAKAYCSGVVHTLPSQQDGIAMILDLVRVSKPGGQVLVAGVPDARKRWRARREAWRLGGLREKAHIVAAATLPRFVKRLIRRLAPGLPRAPLLYLEYDLGEVKTLLEGRGLGCTIVDYPRAFWSRDFRETRSNLLIAVPPRAARGERGEQGAR